MSYDDSSSAPGSVTRGRVGRADEEELEAGPGGNASNGNGGSPGNKPGNRERGSSPGAASGSGGSSGGEQRGGNHDDTDALSSGNDSGESRRGQSIRSGSHGSSNGKDSAMLLDTTDSNKSSTQSLSPPSSSLAYSLLSASSERDPPSTSGCSSDQSARVRTQKELMKALKELKIRLPAERRGKGHSSTLDALKYALSCVKQVRANQEYYHQWSVEEGRGCSLDLSTFTVEELDNISSEYTLRNTDTFSLAVSFLSGKVVYVSPQGAALLRCQPQRLQASVFSELLAPQDVPAFYSGTAPSRLPPWAACIGSVSPAVDCAQEKPMYCRISADRAHGGELRYYPFRLTPYQLTLRASDSAHPQPCCLLIGERVHSGYEAPRIPPDKRIFTTSHSPSCLFQEIDERAVPLLGYLPQDLVGTPVLLYLHPEDRPVMVAIHKKILQLAGQPFDSSPLRMCARSGEYLTLDTSWSSFVNPWSRKVAFIVGRHKVRTSPLNEDVFTPPRGLETRTVVPEIVQLSEQIHRLLVQPVQGSGSQGYSSLGSAGSRGSRGSRSHGNRSHGKRQPLSAGSSCESTGPAHEDAAASAIALLKPQMTFQQMCKDVHMVKTSGQQVFIESRNRPMPRKTAAAALPSDAVRAVCGPEDPIKCLVSDMVGPPTTPAPNQLVRKDPPSAFSYQQINCLDSIIRYLDSCNVPNPAKRKCASSSCTASSSSDDDKQDSTSPAKGPVVSLVGAMHSKAASVASVTSQCSFSSTIVHVGDKKPPESDIVMEEAPPTTSPAPPATPTAIAPPPPPPTPLPIAPPSPAAQADHWGGGGGGGGGRLGLTKEVLSAHTQQEEQAFLCRFKDLSQLRVFDSACPPAHATPLARGVRCSRDYPTGLGGGGRRRGRGAKRLKHQESSDQRLPPCLPSDAPAPPAILPGAFPPPLGPPPATSSSWPHSGGSQASLPPSVAYPPGVMPLYPLYPPLPPHLAVADGNMAAAMRFPPLQAPQLVPPMMALVLPNFLFPQLSPPLPPMGVAMATPDPAQLMPPGHHHHQHFYNPNVNAAAYPFPTAAAPVVMATAPPPPPRGASRSSTPLSSSLPPAEGAESPLFQSRCSSPLNLLQLEESPSSALAAAAAQQATPPAQGGGGAGGKGLPDEAKGNENAEAAESNQDAMSTSSDLLDLLLQEDSRSGTGSAASGSGSLGTGSSGSGSGSSGSGSNGCSSSGSRTRSSQSSHTSKYFGSADDSDDHSRKAPAGGSEEQFIKSVLQDPIWLLMANTDDKVMMTYQLPVRDMEQVLRQDREALKAMQKQQPRFTEEQKRELSQVHPWIRTGRLPRTINISACVGCKYPPVAPAPPYDVEIHEMELCGVLEVSEDAAAADKAAPPETAMEQGDARRHDDKPRPDDQEMTAEEPAAPTARSEEAAVAAETDMTH